MPYIAVFACLALGNFVGAQIAGDALSEPLRYSFLQGIAILACHITNPRKHKV